MRPMYYVGIGIKKIDFGFNITGFTFYLLTYINSATSTAFYINIASSPGNSLHELELSYIVIDVSLQSVLYI
jgi:hypothetical protein